MSDVRSAIEAIKTLEHENELMRLELKERRDGDEMFARLSGVIDAARIKHPWIACWDGPDALQLMTIALMEEVGELSKEILEEGEDERITAEALDVACVAMRIAMRR